MKNENIFDLPMLAHQVFKLFFGEVRRNISNDKKLLPLDDGVNVSGGGASMTEIPRPLNNCSLISFAALFASLAFARVTIQVATQRYNLNINKSLANHLGENTRQSQTGLVHFIK